MQQIRISLHIMSEGIRFGGIKMHFRRPFGLYNNGGFTFINGDFSISYIRKSLDQLDIKIQRWQYETSETEFKRFDNK